MKNLLILFSVLFLVACSKDEANKTQTLAEFVVDGKWIIESEVYNPPINIFGTGKPLVSDYFIYDTCRHDDVFEFTLPDTIILDNGAKRCGISQPRYDYIKWRVINNTEIETSEELNSFDQNGNPIIVTYLDTFVRVNDKLIATEYDTGDGFIFTFTIKKN